jgi:hypothetical protein
VAPGWVVKALDEVEHRRPGLGLGAEGALREELASRVVKNASAMALS